jgi:DNA-binding transcriptional LysR family regulator
MNLRQLHTLDAILKYGSFTSAGHSVNLSHSAISIQMKQLEDELDTVLFDRMTRPPKLTAMGEKLALLSRNVLNEVENIRDTAAGHSLVGNVSIGIVPTASGTLLPVLLEGLRARFPKLQVIVKSDTSIELAAMVSLHQLDFAILTSPVIEIPEVTITEIAAEPLYVVGPAEQVNARNDIELLQSMPFIAFNKKAWLGQQIVARMQSRGIHVQQIMEIDSIDVIENLVVSGFGTSILPMRHLAPPLSEKMTVLPFCDPIATRMLVMMQPDHGRNLEIAATIEQILASIG